VREFLNLPDDASADPDPALFERLLVWRAALEPVVVTWLYQAVAGEDAAPDARRAARATAEVRYGYRMVYAIALLARWRTEPAVPALVDWIRRPRRWGIDDAIVALVHIGPGTHDALWRAMIDVEGDDLGRAHCVRALTAVVRDTALQSAGEVAHPMPVLQPQPAVVRLSERLLALVQDPATGIRLRHEAALRLCDLRQAWAEILQRARLNQHHTISREQLSVREHMSIVLRKLQGQRFVEFHELFDPGRGSAVLVVTFIAMLELSREHLLEVTQAEAFAPIYVRLAFTPS
jgi:hypothetical protein